MGSDRILESTFSGILQENELEKATCFVQGFGSQMIKEILQNMKGEGYAEVTLCIWRKQQAR